MAKPSGDGNGQVTDYRYGKSKRKNIPPAGLEAEGKIAERPAVHYSYDPHRPPVLRFDPSGAADKLPPLLEEARQRPLTADEVEALAEALRHEEPWLEWASKRERQKQGLVVDDIALHIHERVAAKAILAVARRQDVQRDLFAYSPLDYQEAVKFYRHDVDWANRLILGDSLVVMTSLAQREDLAGKVQMIYVDPPYGIRYQSNFQPQVGQRNVADKPQDLTREPEVVKAYRDTWTLGVHSYLAYLRDRLLAAKQLLTDSGSIFVQIGNENVHLVRSLLDEVFLPGNFVALIYFRKKTMPLGAKFLEGMGDYILWYAKNIQTARTSYHQLYAKQAVAGDFHWNWYELQAGGRLRITEAQVERGEPIPPDAGVCRLVSMWPPTYSANAVYSVNFRGEDWWPAEGQCWPTSPDGMQRLIAADRIEQEGRYLRFVLRLADDDRVKLTTTWNDTIGARNQKYVMETSPEVIERCLLMCTNPGDLVLDPTCGGGTTAVVAEKWGRRWITIDTSRVAVALARHRLVTQSLEYYKLKDATTGPAGGFFYEKAPRVSLSSIAQTAALGAIGAKHSTTLATTLAILNSTLATVSKETRAALATKLAAKEKTEGKRAVTEADRRRWLLPKGAWQEWEVPYDADPDWPQGLKEALATYRAAWRAKMDEVNACIAAGAETEDLVDQPEVERKITRVCGPFTVEAVLPPALGLEPEPSPLDEPEEELPTFDEGADLSASDNAAGYLERMLRLLAKDGVRFPDNKQMKFARLDQVSGAILHAEGEWASEGGEGETRRVAVAFGPQYGPVTTRQVEECLRAANRLGFDDLVFAGFAFDAAAQAAIQEAEHPHLHLHLAHIRPDVNLGDLLKETPQSQLFTVYGLPRTALRQVEDGQWQVAMEGVDVYDPVNNVVHSTGADKVAAWFVDGDYDGRTFCICQAFFPDKSAWEKLARALKAVVDEQAFASLSGMTSLPFPAGPHKRVAVKVIDPRGNEVLRVHALAAEEDLTYA